MRATCLLILFAAPPFALAQPSGTAPAASSFVVTTAPAKDGFRATADLPTSQHKRNTGGSDGAGLCVYTSAWHAAIWQSVHGLYGFRDWMKGHPGGSYPEKFEATLNQYCREKGIPVPEYVQHTGGDEDVLRLALKTGRMVSITYCGVDGAGRYGSEVIAHMVNLVHLDNERACIIDNNFPGTFLWMSHDALIQRWTGVQANGAPFQGRDRFGRRFAIGGGWAIILLGAPPAPYPVAPPVEVAAGGDVPGVFGQCENGRCPLPQRAAPVAVPAAPVLSTGPQPIGNPPTEDHEWGMIPGVGWGWDLKKAKPAPPVQAAPMVGQFPPGGVDSAALNAAPEARYMCRGAACTKAEFTAAILGDDSNRWNLSIVGEPSFTSRVKADAEALPKALRDKLHVQAYAPGDWQPAQFKLSGGVTLRLPAVGRVGGDVGTIPAAEYTAAALADLMGRPKGPDPRPVAPPAPAPIVIPQPMPPAPNTPAPLPTLTVNPWAIAFGAAVLLWLFTKGR